jgi:hypothetical protein
MIRPFHISFAMLAQENGSKRAKLGANRGIWQPSPAHAFRPDIIYHLSDFA